MSEDNAKAQPLFSIVVPCYNYADSVGRAIESVLGQTETDWELLLVDDGSTDGTYNELCQYQNQYPEKISAYTQRNQGPAASRNLGVRQATGKFFVFLDADDELLPEALKIFKQAFESSDTARIFIAGHNAISENGQLKYHPPGVIGSDPASCVRIFLLEKRLTLSHGSFAVDRSVFQNYQYPEYFRSSEDISVFVYWLANFKAILIDQPVSQVYKHSDSLRHDISHAKSVGLAVVDETFNEERIPPEVMTLKKAYRVQRLLSMSRTAYSSQEYRLCRSYYSQAFKLDCKASLKGSYLSKFLRSCVKA